MFVNLCCMYSGATLDAYLFTAVMSSLIWSLTVMQCFFCLSHTVFVLKLYCWYRYCFPRYLVPFILNTFFPLGILFIYDRGLSWHLFFFLCISNCSWTICWTRYFSSFGFSSFIKTHSEYIYGSISAPLIYVVILLCMLSITIAIYLALILYRVIFPLYSLCNMLLSQGLCFFS